jgi:hypothetical protein
MIVRLDVGGNESLAKEKVLFGVAAEIYIHRTAAGFALWRWQNARVYYSVCPSTRAHHHGVVIDGDGASEAVSFNPHATA